MKPIVQEWVDEAENNFDVAELLIKQSKPKYNIICFHAQQCAEMYLKACLQAADIFFPKTHELSKLLDLLVVVAPAWEKTRLSLESLTSYAVEYRYPGSLASQSLTIEALEDCRRVRTVARQHLELEKIEKRS